MNRSERVIEHLDAGCNCEEAMVVAFPELVAAPAALCRAATPFGGGVARTGSTCGLVSGAVIVFGWALGREDPSDIETKEGAYAVVAGFLRAVKTACGSTSCTDVLGADLTRTRGGHSPPRTSAGTAVGTLHGRLPGSLRPIWPSPRASGPPAR